MKRNSVKYETIKLLKNGFQTKKCGDPSNVMRSNN